MPRKVFTAGEILTAADVNTNLMDQAVMVFADSTARTAAIPTPSEGMITYLEDTDAVEKFDGSSFVGVATAPAILQVVSTTLTTVFTASVNLGAAADITGLSASITPSSTSSKILVSINLHGSCLTAGIQGNIAADVTRGGTAIGIGDAAGSRGRVSGAQFIGINSTALISSLSFSVLDTPSTTSATTYQARVLNVNDGGSTATLQVNRTGGDTDSNSIPRTASTITLMEVAG